MLRTELDAVQDKALWRVSSGTASVLGLAEVRMDTAPTTAYLMLGERCLHNCAYCAQAHSSSASSAALSRVVWPLFPAEQVVQAVSLAVEKGSIQRVCLQVTSGRDAFERTLTAVKLVKRHSPVPVCCSVALEQDKEIALLLAAGADKVTLALDAACEAVYRRVRGSDWVRLTARLERAARQYPGRLSTHLIVGLGENEREFVERLQWLYDLDISTGLFAFTPVAGTALAQQPPPVLGSYRRMQVARYLIFVCRVDSRPFTYRPDGQLTGFGLSVEKLEGYLGDGTAFRTSGCANCNRPYYNERPGGVMYNYPRPLTASEQEREWRLLLDSLDI